MWGGLILCGPAGRGATNINIRNYVHGILIHIYINIINAHACACIYLFIIINTYACACACTHMHVQRYVYVRVIYNNIIYINILIVNLEEMLVLIIRSSSGNDDPNLIGRGSTIICRRLSGLKWHDCRRRLF